MRRRVKFQNSLQQRRHGLRSSMDFFDLVKFARHRRIVVIQ